jgi:hypothetical protein
MEELTTINESDLDITMRDLAYFSNWMQRAVPAIETNGELPPPPDVESQLVRRWVAAIEGLQDRHRQKLETQESLLKNLTVQEVQLDEVLSNLYTNMAALYEGLGHGDRAGEVKKKFGGLQAVA